LPFSALLQLWALAPLVQLNKKASFTATKLSLAHNPSNSWFETRKSRLLGGFFVGFLNTIRSAPFVEDDMDGAIKN
jgi:hypothetical protein